MFNEVCSRTCYRGRVLFAALTRHAIVAGATIKPVPGHGEQASNPGIALMMCVAHVVIGHG